MDISSLLSPSDELSPANAAPSPRSRPSLVGSNSNSSVSTSTPGFAPRNTQQSPQRMSTSGERVVGAERGDVVMDDAAGAKPSQAAEPLSEGDCKDIQELVKTIAEHPYQYSAHVQCINLLRRAFLTAQDDRRPLLQELRASREEMISIFPMIESMWLEWIADEQSDAETFDERLKVMDLCTRAVTDQVASVKLFKAYGDFMEAQHVYANSDSRKAAMSETQLAEFKELFPYEVVMDTYRQGAHATLNDIANSHLLWDKWRDLVMQDLQSDPTPEKVEFVYRMYQDRLWIPHTTIRDTFNSLSQFVTQHDNANYESIMVRYSKIYSEALEKMGEREIFELRLKREVEATVTPSAEEWNIWSEYLEWETSRPRKKLDEKLSSALYERCLLRFGEQAKVWADYVYFLLEKGGQNSMPKVLSVLQRATRHCPWSGTLWAQHIVALEKGFKPFEEVSEVKHKATKTELLDLGGQEELLKVNVAWCGFLKRRAFEHDAGEEDLDMAEMGINEAVTESDNGKFHDPDYRLQRIQVNFYTAAKKLDLARSIWQELSKSKGTSYEFWLRYYYWELANGSGGYAGAVVKRALSVKDLDWPEKILDTWRTHVEDFGTITEVEAMMVKHRRVSLEIASLREKQAEEQAQTQAQQPAPPPAAVDVTILEARAEHPTSQGNGKRRRGKEDETGDGAQPASKKAKAKEELPPTPPAPAAALVGPAPPSAHQIAKRDRENSSIIVKNLPPEYPEIKVRQLFRDCGTINSLKILNEKNGESATATVEFDSKEDVLAAQTKNLKSIDGHSIEIQVGTGSTLYVTNFPPVADEAYIRNLFSHCGEIVDVRFPSLKYNTHRRFCYVQFSSAEAAERATTLDGQQLGEKERLVAKISAPNRKKDRSSATAEGREVYIRNIDFQATEKDVKDIFSPFGKIEKIRLPPGPKKGTHKGFGFVVFESKDDANASLTVNGTTLKSRALEVSIAQVNPGKPSRPGNAVDLDRNDASPSENQPNGGGNSSPSVAAHASPGPTFDQIKKKTLGIMNLADTVNDIRLRALFEPFGPLRKVMLRPDHQGAIVEYENVADAGRASLKMDGADIDGMRIEIGDQASLMKRVPEKKVTKGFEKKPKTTTTTTTMLVPASVRGGPPGANRGGAGAGRKRGLGFTGAVSRKDRPAPADVEMKTVDGSGSGGNENGGGGQVEKKGKSNDDFKKIFLGRK